MNWGKSIVLVFVLFAGFIGTMVYRMTSQRVDLVSENYYQNEIQFQEQIERVANAHNTSASMTYQPEQQQMVFVLPDNLQKGDITFYRPGDRQQDFQVKIQASPDNRQVVPTRAGERNWRVQFSWSDGQREYYKEEQLYL